MHPVITIKHWSQHISEHLHSAHFWVGFGVALLIIGFAALLVFAAKNAPIEWQGAYPYGGPYIP